VVTPEQTLPLHVALAPAHCTDRTLGPTSLDRFLKTCAAHALPVPVRAVVDASGLDAYGL
jgi:hypothetical protein